MIERIWDMYNWPNVKFWAFYFSFIFLHFLDVV